MNGEGVFDLLHRMQDDAKKLIALEYEIKTLEGIQRWALAQQPVQAGDRVRLVRAPEITSVSGWWSSRHFLIEGRLGWARKIEFNMLSESWTVLWEPDDQTWVHPVTGNEQPVSKPHVYSMAIGRFERVPVPVPVHTRISPFEPVRR